jgi:hypothetical protein
MGQTGPEIVPLMVQKHLRLILQTPERAAVYHPVPVPGVRVSEIFFKTVKTLAGLHPLLLSGLICKIIYNPMFQANVNSL